MALETLPLDDKATYDIFKNGNTTGVFQFESRGMRELLLQAPPKRFDDVIALVALYRPGPMELIPDYVRRKQGAERFEYHDVRLEPILSPTYGVMVYQEQVMQIAQVIGGYTLGAADLLRRVMGKKLPDEMAKHRQGFVSGAIDRGLSSAKATQLFDHMEKFAGYGFNKSHAAAYALIAYQTAYFKAHHPSAFMAANLSLVMDDTDKVRQFYVDALALGLEMLPPDVNASSYRFEPVDERRIRYGLGGIKGTGRAAIEAIVSARDKGPFIDLFDFCRRVDKRVVNRRAVEALIRAGAFDTVESRRASLLASVGAALDHAEHADRAASQVSLFGEHGGDGGAPGPALISAREWIETERLIQEKASLGFYLSGHPYHAYAVELKQLVQQPLGALRPSPTSIRIAGVVAQLRTQTSRRGKMAFVILDDGKDQCEVAIERVHAGMAPRAAALEAAGLRLRAIVMTSLAFGLGCVPLAIASGPGANSLRAIGTGVIGGIVASTVIGTLFAPFFFWILESVSEKFGRKSPPIAAAGAAAPAAPGRQAGD